MRAKCSSPTRYSIRARRLKGLDAFRLFTTADCRKVAESLVLNEAAAGTPLLAEGEVSAHIYILRAGTCTVSKRVLVDG